MFAVAVPTLIMTFASSVPATVFWRFVQGLLLPPIFTVAVAYIGDEWPPAEVARVAGLYMVGASIGGFCGRFIPGVSDRHDRLARRLRCGRAVDACRGRHRRD